VHSLHNLLRARIILCTYGFGVAPASAGQIVSAGEREQGKRECLREFAERALVDHRDLADEALGIEETSFREVGDCVAIVNFPKREVVPPGSRVNDQSDSEKCRGIEWSDDEYRSIVVLAGAIELVADIDAYRAPPDFASMIERPLGRVVDPFSSCGSTGRSFSARSLSRCIFSQHDCC